MLIFATNSIGFGCDTAPPAKQQPNNKSNVETTVYAANIQQQKTVNRKTSRSFG